MKIAYKDQARHHTRRNNHSRSPFFVPFELGLLFRGSENGGGEAVTTVSEVLSEGKKYKKIIIITIITIIITIIIIIIIIITK